MIPFETARGSSVAERVRGVQHELLADVERRSEPVDRSATDRDPFRLARRLRFPVQRSVTEEKSSRTIPALVAYESHLGHEVSPAVVRVLVGLDAAIMAADDFIDAPPERAERTALCATVLFSSLLSFSSVPSAAHESVTDTITQYLTDAARIPLLETQPPTVDLDPAPETGIDGSLDPDPDLDCLHRSLHRSYAHRARDIDVFGAIPADIYDVPPAIRDRIRRDLRTYRARSILADDLADVERDHADGDETPICWLLGTDKDTNPERLTEVLAALVDGFSYSEASADEYREALLGLEPGFDDLDRRVERAVSLLGA